jgi:hypothetical protein
MTNQEAFTTVARHLLTQKERALKPNPHNPSNPFCAYRAEDGKKCAVGCLIPDDLYLKEMEDLPVRRLITDFPNIASLFEGVDLDLLRKLQMLHDSPIDVPYWEIRLRHFAVDFKLQWEL